MGGILLSVSGASVEYVTNVNGQNAVVNGTSSSVSPGTGGSPSPPPPVTAVFASWLPTIADASGNPQVFVTVSATVPTTLGTFIGSECFIDHPDSSGGLAIADGTQPADGTHPANGLFSPDDEGPIPFPSGATTITASFTMPAPQTDQYWRVYVASVAANTVPVPIEYGLSGATPSFQILVTAGGGAQPTGPSSSLGREYAPLVSGQEVSNPPRGWASNPLYETKDSGDQYWELACDWQWPVGDQNYATMGGITPVLDDGVVQTAQPSISKPLSGAGRLGNITIVTGTLRIAPQPVPTGTTYYTLWFVSYDTKGNQNSIVAGVTPSVVIAITRQRGVFGEEYAALVTSDGVHAFVTIATQTGADGTALLQCTGYWANLTPSSTGYDPQFGGAQLDVLKPDGSLSNICGGTLAPIANDISHPATVQTWAFYIRSVDINGRWNSIAPQLTFTGGGGSGAVAVAVVSGGVITSVVLLNGGTGYTSAPTIAVNAGETTGGSGASITCTLSGTAVASFTVVSGGTGYTATPMVSGSIGSNVGLLNLGMAASSSFSSQFSTPSGVLTITALDAGLIITGNLQVGGGSSMPGQMKIFDHLGSLIGWIGDDTGGSGYVGGWCKEWRVGGSSPVTAQFYTDTSGNVTFAGTLTAGMSISTPAISGGSMTGTSLEITSGAITVYIDGTNIVKVTDSSYTCSCNGESWAASDAFGNSTLIGYNACEVVSSANKSFLYAGSLYLEGSTGSQNFVVDTTTTYTATTASAGSQTLPSQPVGFLISTISGVARKIPYYAT